MQLGTFSISQVAIASRPNEVFSSTSYETPAPIIGALGGNVLSQFRVEIDYPDQLLYLEPLGRKDLHDFDTVGLVLDTNTAGQLIVCSVSSSASEVTRRNILPGDIIVGVSGTRKAPQTLTEAAQALSGSVGARKKLRIVRAGKPMNVTAVVVRML